MTFVIFHGSFGSPKENWFPTLAEYLKNLGQEVFVPKFPVNDYDSFKPTDTPVEDLTTWMDTFEKFLPNIKGRELCFVGHSIAPVFILHILTKFNLQLDSAIFVAPFFDMPPDPWQFLKVNKTFYTDKFDFSKLKKLIPVSYAVYGDDDQYIPIKNSLYFAELVVKRSLLRVAGIVVQNLKNFRLLKNFVGQE